MTNRQLGKFLLETGVFGWFVVGLVIRIAGYGPNEALIGNSPFLGVAILGLLIMNNKEGK